MKNQIVSVVGGTGFVGRYVVKLLADKGAQVRVFARDVESEEALALKTAGEVGQIELISSDITKPESLKDKLEDSFAVINLVGILYEGKQKFSAVQAKGAGKLAELAKQEGVKRFVHVSALGADANSKSKYAESKAAGEEAVLAAFPEATILRPSVIFGDEDNFYNKFARMASTAPVVPLIGGGKTKFQPIYVMDVAQAIVACLEQDGVQGNTYELGGPSVYTFREIIEFIGKTTKYKPFLMDVPYAVAGAMSILTGLLPNPPLTCDQIKLLKKDSIVAGGAETIQALGIRPQSAEYIVPFYLARFRRKLA